MDYSEDSAKQFILRRRQAQDSASNNLKKYMLATSLAIIGASWQYKNQKKKFRFSSNPDLDKQVNEELKAMKDKIRSAVITLSQYVNKAESGGAVADDEIESYIDEKIDDETFNQRSEKYSKRYKKELEAIIAAGMFYGLTQTKILSEITTWITGLYNSPLFKRAVKDGGFDAARISTDGISYGNGQYRQSFNSFNRLVNNTIGLAWMWWLGETAMKDGKRFFYSRRGSTYPCELCDAEQAADIRPIQQYTGLYHARCKCYFVFLG